MSLLMKTMPMAEARLRAMPSPTLPFMILLMPWGMKGEEIAMIMCAVNSVTIISSCNNNYSDVVMISPNNFHFNTYSHLRSSSSFITDVLKTQDQNTAQVQV